MRSETSPVIVHTALFEQRTFRPADVRAVARDGQPRLQLNGVAERDSHEAARRVVDALLRSDLPVPAGDVIVDVVPAPVDGDHHELDLAIALAVLVACGHLVRATVAGVAAVGELRSSGAVTNAFPLGHALEVISAPTAVVPAGHLTLTPRPGTEIVRVASLRDAVEQLCERAHTVVTSAHPLAQAETPSVPTDFAGLLDGWDTENIPTETADADTRRRLWRPSRIVPTIGPLGRRSSG